MFDPHVIPMPVSEEAHALGAIQPVELVGDPPDRAFAWAPWMPLRQTTMLSGKGGLGKSLIAQQLTTSVALGRPFLGMDVEPSRAIYITCEDDREEVWRRQVAINRTHDCSMHDLDGRLYLATLSGETDTAVAKYDAGLKLVRTERWHQIEAFAREAETRFIVFDNVTDAMAGDMNDVHQVAQFVNLWTGLAADLNGAVLLLHHPNKGNDDWLGSVAWHNKVRSRLLLKEGDREEDPDLRKLINPKANYGPQGGEKLIRWHEGAFVLDSEIPEDRRADLAATARANADNAAFLACLRELTKQKRAVSERPSSTYAPRVFSDMPESKAIGRKRLEAAMDRLFRVGAIGRGELWRTDQRKTVFGLQETGQ